jgi:hypothetical protein
VADSLGIEVTDEEDEEEEEEDEGLGELAAVVIITYRLCFLIMKIRYIFNTSPQRIRNCDHALIQNNQLLRLLKN